jgi:CBS domain-containing protein
MVDDGLITVEEVDVVQYAPGRRPDPLAQPVQDVMRSEVVSVRPATPAAEIVTLLLQKGYGSLPVLDENGRLLGIITDGDLLRRAGLAARLDLQAELSAAAWQQQVSELRAQSATALDLMTSPVITIAVAAPLHQAGQQMAAHHLKRLPVVEENGRLVGWISRVDILRTLEYHQAVPEAAAESPAHPRVRGDTTIATLMYRDVPAVPPQATLEEILQALEQNRRRRAVVVDADRHVIGIITDGDLLRRTQKEIHPGLLQRLRELVSGQSTSTFVTLPETTEVAVGLMTAPVVTIPVDAHPTAALRLMMQHGIKRLPVVDGNGRLVGLLGRASLLRGLLAASGAANEE